jgi:c-di-GMP-binding flagellar brake protein YcgR
MKIDPENMLTQAIERNSAAVLALPSAGMFRYHKTRFLRGVGERVWLESVADDQPLLQSLIGSGEQVSVTFKAGPHTAVFSSPILELDGAYQFFDSREPIQAVLMNRPASVKPLQRRTNFRVMLRPEDGFRVRLWRINEKADVRDQPNDLCEMPTVAADLSTGGIGVVFAEKPLLVSGQRLRVLLSWGSRRPMIIEGRAGQVRHDKPSNTYTTGIQFQLLQASLEGRQFLTELTRTVSWLQLEDAKRNRAKAG